MLEKLIELYEGQELLKADGFDGAIIGIDEHSMRLIYSVAKCIEIINEKLNFMIKEEALEYFNYNVHSIYVGESTPIFCWDLF